MFAWGLLILLKYYNVTGFLPPSVVWTLANERFQVRNTAEYLAGPWAHNLRIMHW